MINLGVYTVTFSLVAERLTPWFWRFPKWLSYLKSALTPLQTNNNELSALVNNTWTKLSYTGQHLALEEFLNDTYDFTLRRIFIDENNITFPLLAIGLDSETNPAPVAIGLDNETNPAPVAIGLAGEGLGNNNFTVNIPAGVTFTEATLRSQVDFYVVAGKIYNIVIF